MLSSCPPLARWISGTAFVGAALVAAAQSDSDLAPAAAVSPLDRDPRLFLDDATSAEDAEDRTLDSFLRYGPVIFTPGISYSVAYSDNIFGGVATAPGASKDDVVHRIAPDLSFLVLNPSSSEVLIPEIGYIPEFVFYHDNSDQNTINHSGRLKLSKVLPKTSFALSHDSSSRQDVQPEAARLERSTTHDTVLGITYDFGGKTSLESVTAQTLQARGGIDLNQWSQDFWVDYDVLPKVSLGLGAGVGYSVLDPGFDAINQPTQLRLKYSPTAKLTAELRGGVEWLHVLGAGGRDSFSPIAGITLSYDTFRSTTIALLAEHRVSSSIYRPDQLSTYSTVGVALHQELPGNWYTDLSARYSAVEMEEATTTAAAASSYDFYEGRLDFGYKWTERIRTAGYYRRLGRSGGAGLPSFTANEVGLNLAYHF